MVVGQKAPVEICITRGKLLPYGGGIAGDQNEILTEELCHHRAHADKSPL